MIITPAQAGIRYLAVWVPARQTGPYPKKRLISFRHAGPPIKMRAGPIPAKGGIFDQQPAAQQDEKTLDSPSTSLRVVSLSNHGSSPE